MQIKEIRVRNFRSILDEVLPCDNLTALVGRNGAGKSAFLSALELFYARSPVVSPEDFYAEDMTREIEIEITFGDLSEEATELFAPYMQQEQLKVVRVFSENQGRDSGTFHGSRLQNPDFESVRNAGRRSDINTAYREIRETDEYSSLPPARSADDALEALATWELQNPDKCSFLRDDGQFFGYTQVGGSRLGRFTNFLLIPAVRDAQEDATEGRGSPITQMMDLVVRNVLTNRQELSDFKQRTREQFSQIMAPERLTELADLQGGLTQTLQSYVPDAGVILQWSPFSDISFPTPQAEVKLVEDGYESTVDRTGHGLQRAFILTMLQHLSTAGDGHSVSQDEESGQEPTQVIGDVQIPNLVLAIEEPELYQHPSRQRHLASVLSSLATGENSGVARQTQVIYTTHSPLFVGLDRFDKIRVLRKSSYQSEGPKITVLRKANMQALAEELGQAHGSPSSTFTAETLRHRLQTLMTPWMNEGFFADTVVLVEGENDRAAILGVAEYLNHNFDSEGIAVIPCGGKSNLDKPLIIFRQLGIPVYVLWDSDYSETNSEVKDNHALLHLLDEMIEDWPAFVKVNSACFKVNLENTLKEEIGRALFGQLLDNAKDELGIRTHDQARKHVAVLRRIIETAASTGEKSTTVEDIVTSIVELNRAHRQ